MIGSFEFNNIESKTHKLICRSVKRILTPGMKSRSIELNGKSGIIDFGNNDYTAFTLVMHIAYVGESYIDLRSRTREIAAWLSTKNWQKLIINDESDKYYLARVISEIDLDTFKRLGEADISFICQPFAYMLADTGADDTWEEASYPWITPIPWDNTDTYNFTATGAKAFTFENPGTKETNFRSPQGSKFDIRITGSFTTLSLSLNGKTFNYNQVVTNGTVTIDNVEMEVDLNGINKLNFISGDIATFLEVVPGDNIISVSGTGLNVEITLDFTPMWI